MTNKKIAVVLFNLGGPDSLEAVEPFLFNLFSDKYIFKIPFAQKFFAKIISRKRAPKVIAQYEKIGGRSPINEITEKQREALENALRQNGLQADVFTAMRYWKPTAAEAAEKIKKGSYGKIVLLSLYPHYSKVTIGSSLYEWNKYFPDAEKFQDVIYSYHDNPLYIKALNNRIDEALEKFPEKGKTFVLFSAHGVPESLPKSGDPYVEQIKETVELAMKNRDDKNDYGLSFQSKVGPVKWVEPSTENKITELAKSGVENLLVVPVSFVSDHLETLYELNIEYAEVAEKNGIKNYRVTEGLNDSPLFIDTLKTLVSEKLKNGN